MTPAVHHPRPYLTRAGDAARRAARVAAARGIYASRGQSAGWAAAVAHGAREAGWTWGEIADALGHRRRWRPGAEARFARTVAAVVAARLETVRCRMDGGTP